MSFVYTFPRTGQVILCAYSAWVTDTAASASLVVKIGAPTSAAKGLSTPVNATRPQMSRSGSLLICNRGTWRRAVSYAYGWWVNGKHNATATDETQAVTPTIKGHTVVCEVTGYDAAGKTTASSAAFAVH